MPQFTYTEQKLLKVLADGRPHEVRELLKCLDDDYAEEATILVHICKIRKKLKPHKQYIRSLRACEGLPLCYVHVTHSNSVYLPRNSGNGSQ